MGEVREQPADDAALHPMAARAALALSAVAEQARAEQPQRREWTWQSDAAGRLNGTGAPDGWGADGLAGLGGSSPALAAALAWHRPFRAQRIGEVALSGTPLFSPGDGRFEGYRGFATQVIAAAAAGAGPAFDAQLAHEVRTPLNAVIGFAELIADGDAPPAMRDAAAGIRDTARRVLGALDDLTDAARLDLGRYPLRDGWIDAAPVIASAGGRARCDIAGPLWMHIDEPALTRLVARLVEIAGGDAPRLAAAVTSRESVAITITRAEGGEVPLLGADFALRLAAQLAARLGGTLETDSGELRLTLPALRAEGVATASRLA